jgi:hypothetical protein
MSLMAVCQVSIVLKTVLHQPIDFSSRSQDDSVPRSCIGWGSNRWMSRAYSARINLATRYETSFAEVNVRSCITRPPTHLHMCFTWAHQQVWRHKLNTFMLRWETWNFFCVNAYQERHSICNVALRRARVNFAAVIKQEVFHILSVCL